MTTLATLPAAGSAYLQFTRSGSETVLTRSFASSPLKVFGMSSGASARWVYAATLGGGLVGGDEIAIHATVSPGARAFLTTQASTKVYRSLRPARQNMSARIDAGGVMAVLPDPVVCFAGADFSQRQEFDLHRDANLVVLDWMTSGRHANGERWAFSRYDNRSIVTRDGRIVLFDAIVLEPDLDSVAERMKGFDVLLTAVITGPLVAAAAESIRRLAAECGVAKGADLILTASALSDGGTLLRMAGPTVERVGKSLREVFAPLNTLLGDDRWSRKW